MNTIYRYHLFATGFWHFTVMISNDPNAVLFT